MSTYSLVVGGNFRTTTVGVVEATNIAVWTDEVASRAPGATINVMKLAIRAAFREFCVRSGAWIRAIGPIDVFEGLPGYEVPPQDDASILYLNHMVWTNQNTDGSQVPLKPVQAPFYAGYASRSDHQPRAWHGANETPGTFTILPTPLSDVEGALTVWCSLGPKDPHADDIPLQFLTHHYDALLNGACARLLSEQNKPYTNLVMAVQYSRQFNTAISKARDMSRRQYTMTDTTHYFPRWA